MNKPKFYRTTITVWHLSPKEAEASDLCREAETGSKAIITEQATEPTTPDEMPQEAREFFDIKCETYEVRDWGIEVAAKAVPAQTFKPSKGATSGPLTDPAKHRRTRIFIVGPGNSDEDRIHHVCEKKLGFRRLSALDAYQQDGYEVLKTLVTPIGARNAAARLGEADPELI